MNRTLPAVLVVAVLALAGCGSKSGTGSTDASAPSAGATATPSSSGWTPPGNINAGPVAADTPIDQARVEQGETLFKTKGCSACHAFGHRGAGPDLAGVTRRQSALWMTSQILHPDVMTKQDPTSRALFAQFMLQMPNQGLTPDEAKSVIEYFKHQDAKGAEASNEKSH